MAQIESDLIQTDTLQLINRLEHYPLTLKGCKGEDIIFNIKDLNVEINIIQDISRQYTEQYWADLTRRLEEYKATLGEQISSLDETELDETESKSYKFDIKGDYSEILGRIENIDINGLRNLHGNDSLLGTYESSGKRVNLYISNIQKYASTNRLNPEHLIVSVFIHEMFHAFFDNIAGQNGGHYIREIEEAMAECGVLCYLKMVKEQDRAYTEIYNTAKKSVQGRQQGHWAAYGFGLYLHEQAEGEYHKKLGGEIRILGEYAQKSAKIDQNSLNVIRYVTSVLCDYPHESSIPHEGERFLFTLLIQTILNTKQEQSLSFTKMYKDMREKLKESLLEQWQPKGLKFNKEYEEQLKSIVDQTVSDKILVENMSMWQGAGLIGQGNEDYTKYIESRLLKFLPYQHQVECWTSILTSDTHKSMVVTTGTGSGKTESFMVPLITDLANRTERGLKAIFLYPLNALMEDQKTKLNEMIEKSGSSLKFAVYNGQSPSFEYVNRNGGANNITRFSHEVIFREEIRGSMYWDPEEGTCKNGGQVPDIILTNPTMLEYMLLRRSDKAIIDNSQNTLSWIVIDETHTYNGAGADEMAMLMRRVLKGFNKSPEDVHFATSSATVGNSDDDLLKFISGITGQGKDSIKIIKGHRSTPDFSLATTENKKEKYRLLSLLRKNDYIYLDKLIDYKTSVEEKLEELDRLCEGGLKVKVHFFVEALTNGLYTDLEDLMFSKDHFLLTHYIPLDKKTFKPASHYVGVRRCLECGSMLASCKVDSNNYRRINNIGEVDKFIAIDNHNEDLKTNSSPCEIIPDNKIIYKNERTYALVSNDSTCPCCGAEEDKIRPFNISSSKCMRSINPVLLDNACIHEGEKLPHKGQQFISFADSRKGAAEPSMIQNLETEKKWVISIILKLLKEERVDGNSIKVNLESLKRISETNRNDEERNRLIREIGALDDAIYYGREDQIYEIARRNNLLKNYVTWQEVLSALYGDDNCERLAASFAKEHDLNPDGTLSDGFKRRYVLGALYNTMHKRSKDKFSAESYGILRSHYAQLDDIQTPDAVNRLNEILRQKGKNVISVEEWRNFLKIYLDFHVRPDEDLFYKGSDDDWDTLDINDCRNLKTQVGLRRSIKDPIKNKSVHYKLLWRLFDCDDENQLSDVDPSLPVVVTEVIQAMWDDLTRENLIEIGQQYKRYNEGNAGWHNDTLTEAAKKENRTKYRLNLDRIQFSLYEKAYVEPNTKSIIDTTFMGLSPYQDDFKKNRVSPTEITAWNPPYKMQKDEVKKYYDENGVGYLCNKELKDILCCSDMFIQYEHTAQVAKELTSSRIQEFKDHKINILACSTTMEMGVDIGELEIVSMSNVPPHPANYKQRAGRAGRAFQNKSTSITICNSDAVGIPAMGKPREELLEREIITPTADLNSPQVVQRHINSYLLRKFLSDRENVSRDLTNRSIKDYAILDFFLSVEFHFNENTRVRILSRNEERDGAIQPTNVYPNNYNDSFHDNSLYKGFIEWLQNLNHNDNREIYDDVTLLKRGTKLDSYECSPLINNARADMEKLFASLKKDLEAIRRSSGGIQNWDRLEGYAYRLNMDFVGILKENLITYLSTHQFTPNANMPVNIVQLKINKEDDSFSSPSRDLLVALNEYAPGKSVVIDCKRYTIAGVDWGNNEFRHVNICEDCGHTWEAGAASSQCPMCSSDKIRNHNMVEPIAFLPEQDTDRIIDSNQENAIIDAYLIGGDTLSGKMKRLTALCDYDTESPAPNTKIMYINKGYEFGYCICRKCGRAVPEKTLSRPGDTQDVRDLMYSPVDVERNGEANVYEHNNLRSYDKQDRFNIEDLYRNMYIGGSISTNFSLLKPYHNSKTGDGRTAFHKDNYTDESILTTLGILVCEELSKYIPCQRQDIDFLITSFRRNERVLCIYDTAKGGAGYSSQLDEKVWQDMLAKCNSRLSDIIEGNSTIESMFTRSTMRYLDMVDVLETYRWLSEEQDARNPVPQCIIESYPNAVRSTIIDIKESLANANDAILFVNADVQTWNYELPDSDVPSWKETRSNFRLEGNERITLAFCGDPGTIPFEVSDIIRKSADWASFSIAEVVNNGAYPIAYINGWLYLTDEEATTRFDGYWASGRIFAVQADAPRLNRDYEPNLRQSHEFFIEGNSQASSMSLLETLIIHDDSNVIRQFIANARGHRIKFHYMDEHIKTQLGAILIVQLIKAFIDQIGCDIADFSVEFEIERYLINQERSYSFHDRRRRIWDTFQSNEDTELILDSLLGYSYWNYRIITQERNTLPHWRCLFIEDLNNGSKLCFKPHGGIANGWKFDSNRASVYFGADNTDLKSDIPLVSDNELQFTIGIK